MSFWIIACVVGGLVAAILVTAINRARQQPARDQQDIDIYKDQLAEIDRDVARGVMSPEEAELSRVEISRRLLRADAAADAIGSHQDRSASSFLVGAVVAIVVLGGTAAIYSQIGAPAYPDLPLKERIALADELRQNRPSQDEAETRLGNVRSTDDADPDHLELMVKLRTALAGRPDDLQGHMLLAQNEAALGNYKAAYQAQEAVLRIRGAAATAADFADLADLLILAAGGYVSPTAEMALTEALGRDPQNGTARYYTGLMYAQNARPDLAFRVWRPLLEQSVPSDPWVGPIQSQIAAVAADAGVRYEEPAPQSAPAPGPDADDIAAAAEMSPEDRAAMIQGMVQGLSDRLATEGGPASDWARLISALVVLGETENATAILQEAREIFAASPADLALIDNAATQAGLTP